MKHAISIAFRGMRIVGEVETTLDRAPRYWVCGSRLIIARGDYEPAPSFGSIFGDPQPIELPMGTQVTDTAA